MNSIDSAARQTAANSDDLNSPGATSGVVESAAEIAVSNSKPALRRRRRIVMAVAFLFVAITASGVLFATFANKKTELSEAESQLARPLQINVGLEIPRNKVSTDAARGGIPVENPATARLECICDLFDDAPPDSTDHPLDSCLEVARRGLAHIRKNYSDYTASLVKRERIGGKLGDEEFLFIKIRHERKEGDQILQPLSVYLKFLAPKSVAGREVIWVQGRNNDRLIAHGNGLTRFIKVNLHPTDALARQGNRYPLTEIGIETLSLRMLEKGRQDQRHGECEVHIDRAATINDRPCTRIEIVHQEKRPHFEFHIAELFIDDEYNVPVRYAAYSWPTETGGAPVLEEEYTYRDLKFNVGLTDKDFDPANPEYSFP